MKTVCGLPLLFPGILIEALFPNLFSSKPGILATLILQALAAIATSTTQTAATRLCNNYYEFCDRSYANITEICAHNSPFHVKDNVASNQDYDVLTQLNDGIRVLEGQTHMQNGVLHFCHTVCALLDAGPAEDYFRDVAQWLSSHPDEVVTIIIANGDRSSVPLFASIIQSSGLGAYVWTPTAIPMKVSDWPTLGQMITQKTRAVIFMDNGANQAQVPYILDQYSQLWQTPTDPTNASFPCTLQQLDGLNPGNAAERMYLANLNLNRFLTADILIPDLDNINRTNSASGTGSIGLAANNCAATWERSPNFLVVDYYNRGSPAPGSVFEAAAKANGVTYTRPCCNTSTTTSTPVSSSSAAQPTMATASTMSTGASIRLSRSSFIQIILLTVMLAADG